MPIMQLVQPLSLPAGHPGADLPGILEPYLWLEDVGSVYAAGYRGPLLYLNVHGIVKMQGEPYEQAEPAGQDEAYTRAHLVRSHLAAVAEMAIIAVEDAGYLHDDHPQMEITGDLRRRRDGRPDLLVAKAVVRMRLTRSDW